MPAIESVRPGDVIVEGRDKTVVSKVEVHACSSRGTHINSKYCYDPGSIVQVNRGKGKEEEDTFDEDLQDLQEHLQYEADSRLY